MKHFIFLFIVAMGCLAFLSHNPLDQKIVTGPEKDTTRAVKVLPPPIRKFSVNAALTEPRSGVPPTRRHIIARLMSAMERREGVDLLPEVYRARSRNSVLVEIFLAQYGCVANHISY